MFKGSSGMESRLIFLCFLFISINAIRRSLTMQWIFSGKGPSIRATGNVGSEGELYFTPYKRVTLKAPEGTLGNTLDVPVFPHTSVLVPGGVEWLNVYEMRFRHLFYDVGERGLFAFTYTPPSVNKAALVGTLARIKERKMMTDGRAFIIIEGVKPFFIKEFTQMDPYVRATVQKFSDYVSNPVLARNLEQEVFTEIRVNYKMAQMLYPNRNFTFTSALIRNRPPSYDLGAISGRIVDTMPPNLELKRQSDFTFAVIDMLQVSAPTKLSLLQQPMLEKRMQKLLEILKNGGNYLRDQLLQSMSAEQVEMMRLSVLHTSPEDDLALSKQKFEPALADTLVDGSLVLKAIPM